MKKPQNAAARSLLKRAVQTRILTESQTRQALEEIEAGASPDAVTQILVKKGVLKPRQVEQLSSLASQSSESRPVPHGGSEEEPPRAQVLNAPAAAPPTSPDLTGQRFGAFQIVRELGRGGMGVVYEAVQTSLKRSVALKVLSPSLSEQGLVVARFLREARATAKLRHPNIVQVYDTGRERELHYIAMELIRGASLDGMIPPDGLSPRRAAEIALAAAGALSAAHEAGIIHRDVNPSNILIDAKGHVFLTDFGLAKDAADGTLTGTGVVLGTAVYMPPEQAQGEPVDAQADVYSLGATLYELLTGRRPFPGTTWQELIRQVLLDDLVPPSRHVSTVPSALEGVVMKAMEKEKKRRYETMEALRIDLNRWLNA